MTVLVEFDVIGIPKPQGSKAPFNAKNGQAMMRIEEAKGISRLPLTDGEAVPSDDEIAAQAARETDAEWEASVTNTLDGINGQPAKAAVKT